MGHQINAARGLEIAWTNGAWQVVYWCEPFWDDAAEREFKEVNFGCGRRDADASGVTFIPEHVVAAADAALPASWEAALAGDFIKVFDRNQITEEDFYILRGFLSKAALGGHSISGSY